MVSLFWNIFVYGEGGDEEKKWRHSWGRMTEDDWLQWRKQGRAKQILFIYIGDRTFPLCVCVRVCNFYLRSLLVWRPTPMNDDGDRPERRETYFIVSRSLSSRQSSNNNNSKRVKRKMTFYGDQIWYAAQDFSPHWFEANKRKKRYEKNISKAIRSSRCSFSHWSRVCFFLENLSLFECVL